MKEDDPQTRSSAPEHESTAFNAYAERFNAEHADAIGAGQVAAIEPSSAAFIEKASGIRARYVMEKEGILDPAHMTARSGMRAVMWAGSRMPSFSIT